MRLIDADELIKTLSKYAGFTEKIDLNAFIKEIDNAPTVPNEYMRGYEAAEREYKRPQGEWISDYRTCKCSVCNFTTVIDTYNFCPNCGADMRGKEE